MLGLWRKPRPRAKRRARTLDRLTTEVGSTGLRSRIWSGQSTTDRIQATAVLVAATVVTVAASPVSVRVQVVRPDPTTDSSPTQADIARDGATVPGE